MAWIASEHPQVGGEEPSPDFEPSAVVGGAVDDGTVAAPTQSSTQKAASHLRRRIICTKRLKAKERFPSPDAGCSL